MGNSNSIKKNLSLNKTNYITKMDLYIHPSNNGYYISTNMTMCMGSGYVSDNLSYYIVPKNSVIKICKFDYKNGELQLLAKIEPDGDNNGLVWKLLDKYVNVVSLFSLEHHSDKLLPQ